MLAALVLRRYRIFGKTAREEPLPVHFFNLSCSFVSVALNNQERLLAGFIQA